MQKIKINPDNFDTKEIFRNFRQNFLPAKISCPRCATDKIVIRKENPDGKRLYACKNCKKEFNDFTGTLFENIRINMRVLIKLMDFFTLDMSAHNTFHRMKQREYQISYKTVWKMFHLFRQLIGRNLKKQKNLPSAVVEVDEVFLSLKKNNQKNRHYKTKKRYMKHRNKRGRGSKLQTAIMTVTTLGDSKNVYFMPLKTLTSREIKKKLAPYIHETDVVYTDKFKSYIPALRNQRHRTVDHTKNYVNPHTGATTNNCENAHHIAIRRRLSAYIQISRAYIQSYLNELAWKFLNKRTVSELFVLI